MKPIIRVAFLGVVLLALAFFPASSASASSHQIDRAAFNDLTISPEIMRLAMSQKLVLGGNNKLQNGAGRQSYGFYTLALASALNPAVSFEGRKVTDQLLTQIRELIGPGHEPNAGAGLNGWTHSVIAEAFDLIKHTPEVWGKLTGDEKNRIDWIMKAMAVAGHFGFDDGNDYRTSLHADDNTSKRWNPNHRLYLFVVLAAADYFGPDELNKIYTSFDFDEYVKKFDELGFSNIKAVWTCHDWKTILEKGGTYVSPKKNVAMGTGTGVRHSFTYNNLPLSDLPGIFCSLTEFCYGKPVVNGIEGKSWILNNGVSPFLGQQGMIMEFDSHDAEGTRSDIDYCNENFCSYTLMLLTLKVLGIWPDTDRCKNLEKLIFVGNEDMLYKNATGFHSYSHDKGRDSAKLEDGKWTGFIYVSGLWNGYLKNRLKPR